MYNCIITVTYLSLAVLLIFIEVFSKHQYKHFTLVTDGSTATVKYFNHVICIKFIPPHRWTDTWTGRQTDRHRQADRCI